MRAIAEQVQWEAPEPEQGSGCEECDMLVAWSPNDGSQCAECARTAQIASGLPAASAEPEVVETMSTWPACEAGGMLAFHDVHGDAVSVPWSCLAEHPRAGIPTELLPERMWRGWATPEQGLSHPNRRFSETQAECLSFPDPVTLAVSQTGPVPVMWYHTAQRERMRRVLGQEPPIEAGPRPNLRVVLPLSMEGLFEPHMVEATYGRRVRQHAQIRGEFARQREGLPFRTECIEGGRDGVTYGPYARKVQYRHLVFRNVDGRPEVVDESLLPDRFTDMDLEALLRMCADCQAPDMEAVTELALYGMRSLTACQPTTRSWLLYRGGIEGAAFLRTNRDKQRDGYATPRVSQPEAYPRFEPERMHPKSVETVVKPDGTLKERETTDYGAERSQAVEAIRQWRVRILRRRQRDVGRDWQARRYGAKGRPGLDSYNACVQNERVGDLAWGSIHAFAEAVDVLLSSGLPVDCKNDDFEAFFPQFPLWVGEHWLATQLIDERGSEVNERPDFGGTHLPVKTSRCNYDVLHCIDVKLWRLQESRLWALAPWSRDVVDAVDTYVRVRRERGGSGRLWYQFGWIDDNSAAAIRVFSASVWQVRYQVWTELKWVWDKAKSVECLYGQLAVPATVGIEVRAQERRLVLPSCKIDKYSQAAAALQLAAEQHPRALVESVQLERVTGQYLHAADLYIEMWIFFMDFIGSIDEGVQLETHTVLSKSARHALRKMTQVMRTGGGRPLTPYKPRPGADGLPVFLTWSDAGRNTRTFKGAIGAYFHLYGLEDIFFIAEALPRWLVQLADITQMEQHAADVIAAVQAIAFPSAHYHGDGPRQYLIQTGDSQSVFRFVLNTMRARTRGMRPLAASRWQAEKSLRRLVCGVWVPREDNRPADALANLDLVGFVQQMQLRYSDSVRFCRLAVPQHILISDALLCAVRSGAAEAKRRRADSDGGQRGEAGGAGSGS